MRFLALLMALIFISAAFLPVPAFASFTDLAAQPVVATPASTAAQPAQDQGTVGGVQPVSPEKFAGKLTKLADAIYQAASPVTDAVAKTSVAFAGVLLIFFLVTGYKVASRAIGAVVSVVVGLLLWYGAPYFVALIKWLAAWLQS
jgi:hypothetical protein